MSIDTVTLRLKVETLDVAAHGDAIVHFYIPTAQTGALVPVDGALTKITHGVGVVNLRVDGVWYAVDDGTLVSIETGEIR